MAQGILEKFILIQLVKKFSVFMVPKCLLPCWQKCGFHINKEFFQLN